MEYELKDLILNTVDYRGKTPKRFDSGIPVISSANVKKGKIVLDDKYVSKEYYDKWTTRGHLKPKDILITTEAPVGEIAKIPEKGTFLISRRVFALRVNESLANPTFVYYTLLTEGVLKYFEAISHGATAPRIYKDEVLKLKLKLPNLPTQKKIASVLSAYDDLIENNNQRIQLLEDMAQEIYKEWFVRFRFPDYQNTTFVDKDGNQVPHGTKGAVPKGWDKKPLQKVFSHIVLGGTPSRSVERYWKDGTVDWIKSGKLNDKIVLTGSEKITEKAVENSATELLPEKTVLIAITGAILIGFSAIELCANQSVIGIYCSAEISQSYLYLDQRFNQRYYEDRMTGSAQQHINKEVVSNYKILVPDRSTSEKFDSIVEPIYEEIILLHKKNQVLQGTRDLLLPRLISGKLSVDNIPLPENELQMAAEPSENYK